MNFRTEITIPHFDFDIDYSLHGFSAGSCFADNMAGRLQRLKFPVASNPLGVMFNPLSIMRMLEVLDSGTKFRTEDLTYSNGLWFSYLCHGEFSSNDAQRTLSAINWAIEHGAEELERADYVIITFGTAWIYRLVENGMTVANCHKQPSSMFERHRMSVEEVVGCFEGLMRGMLARKKVIFTVSPVRHVKDGLAENSLSKAILRVAVQELSERHKNALYFPAYEILNDDLRDYRFYAEDLVHPSAQAVDFVWEKFAAAAMSRSTIELSAEVEKIVRASEHRIQNPESEQSRKFMKSMYDATARLLAVHPEIDLGREADYFAAKR